MGTRLKLLASRVADAHARLVCLERWWRRQQREAIACRLVLRRLWKIEVDCRVGLKVMQQDRGKDEGWKSKHTINKRRKPTDNRFVRFTVEVKEI